LKGPALQVGEA